VIRQIIALQLRRIGDRLRENHRAELTVDDAVTGTIAGRCKEVESGARNVDHILTGTLLPEVSREVLARMAEGQPVQRVHVGVDGEGKFVYQIS
jgi:type VI secretion system protein VasG